MRGRRGRRNCGGGRGEATALGRGRYKLWPRVLTHHHERIVLPRPGAARRSVRFRFGVRQGGLAEPRDPDGRTAIIPRYDRPSQQNEDLARCAAPLRRDVCPVDSSIRVAGGLVHETDRIAGTVFAAAQLRPDVKGKGRGDVEYGGSLYPIACRNRPALAYRDARRLGTASGNAQDRHRKSRNSHASRLTDTKALRKRRSLLPALGEIVAGRAPVLPRHPGPFDRIGTGLMRGPAHSSTSVRQRDPGVTMRVRVGFRLEAAPPPAASAASRRPRTPPPASSPRTREAHPAPRGGR